MSADTVILAIDAGNTRIKWGVHDGHAWSATGAVATAESQQLYEALRPALPVESCVAANVATTCPWRSSQASSRTMLGPAAAATATRSPTEGR